MSEQQSVAAPKPVAQISGVVPILRVADFERSKAYYVERLGFHVDWEDGNFGSVSRGRTSIMLSEGAQGCTATWMWIGTSDADALHDELRERGATIRHPPTNYPWGSREVHVFDADGHVLRFGAESEKDAPLGPWLDERGVRWAPQPDGSWSRMDEDG
jgi:catechol 2,3-dioxygenase-like lactoylglutathione lyase family enzyme